MRQKKYSGKILLISAFGLLVLSYVNCAPGFQSKELIQTSPSALQNGQGNSPDPQPLPSPIPGPQPGPAPLPAPLPAPMPTPVPVVYPENPVPPGVQAQEVSCQFGATEGPSWSPQNFLVFTDWGHKLIYKYQEETNRFTVYVNQGDAKDGTTYDRNGSLITVSFGESGGKLLKVDQSGNQTVLASTFQGKRFNALNDVAIFKDNSVFFTDTGQPNEIPYTGVFRYRPNGQIDLIDSTLSYPNGLGFSPDYKKLYVTGGNSVYQYDVADDGSVSNRRLFYSPPTNTGGSSGQDGLAVDAAGNVYITFHERIWVVSSAGKLVTFIPVYKGYLTNVAFGSKDLKTLYITTGICVYRIRLLIPGMPFG